MADEVKPSAASFGKLFQAFLLILLFSLFIISMQTSTKQKEANEKNLEYNLSIKLDDIISDCFLHNYVKNSFKKVIDEARHKGADSPKLPKLINDCKYEDYISMKGFFYKDNKLIQTVNTNKEEEEFAADFFKYLDYNRLSQEFVEAHRKTLKTLVDYFGIGSRLELVQLRKGFFSAFSVLEKSQHFHWDKYDNGVGLMLYTTDIPSTSERFENILSKNKDKNYGFINSNNLEIIPPKGFTEEQTLAAFINTGKSNKPLIIANDHYWYFQTNRFDQKFCYVVPINDNSFFAYDWAELLQKISGILFIIIAIIYLTSVINCIPGKNVTEFLDNLSIKYRIIGIFTMASVFPVLMTAVIGNSLLSDKQSVIEKNILSESLDVIYNIENQREVLLENTKKMSEDIREKVKEAYLNNQPIDGQLFYKCLEKHSIAPELCRLDVRDSEIKNIFTMDDRETQGAASIFDLICRLVLKTHCPSRLGKLNLKVSPAELVSESVLSTDEVGFASLIRQRNEQFTFKVGAFPTTWYWDIYPELATGPAFICVTTQVITTFSKHITDYIYSLPVRDDNIQLAVFVNNPHFVDSLITPHKHLPHDEIIQIANVTFDTNKVLFRSIDIQGKPYWITAKHEKQANSHVFMNIVSKKERLAVLEPFKWQLIIIGIFALTISLFGAWFITSLIILPVGDLSKGILAIRQRNKDFTIPVRRKDEFGELAKAFNQVIGDFEELEYGKIVQESLLPPSAPIVEGYDIAFFTVSATDLAGDYHDYVILDDGKISVILGDVSGHGISASLAMAMAKATFNYAKSKKVKFPEEFMDMLNIMFNKELKPRNKLMTLISMTLTPETGEVIFDNAGQSYPAYYTSSTQSSEEIKMPSLPLGGMKKRKKKPINKMMEHGDAFIFYTDGMIEASAADGEMFGYERFFAKFTEQMQQNVSSKDAIHNIFQAMEDFREPGPHSDDITMVIVKRL